MTNQTHLNQPSFVTAPQFKLSHLTQAGETFTVIEFLGPAATRTLTSAGEVASSQTPDSLTLILNDAELAELRHHLLASQPKTPGDPVGQVITAIRALKPGEVQALDWMESYPILTCPVLVLSDGTYLYPVQDEEGNGPGCLWGRHPDGQDVTILLEVE